VREFRHSTHNVPQLRLCDVLYRPSDLGDMQTPFRPGGYWIGGRVDRDPDSLRLLRRCESENMALCSDQRQRRGELMPGMVISRPTSLRPAAAQAHAASASANSWPKDAQQKPARRSAAFLLQLDAASARTTWCALSESFRLCFPRLMTMLVEAENVVLSRHWPAASNCAANASASGRRASARTSPIAIASP
jgi:hypothetical protein